MPKDVNGYLVQLWIIVQGVTKFQVILLSEKVIFIKSKVLRMGQTSKSSVSFLFIVYADCRLKFICQRPRSS